jgi:hypothetical protein
MKTPGQKPPEGDHADERKRQFEDSRGLHEPRELDLDDEEAGDQPSGEKRRPRDDGPDEDTDEQEGEEGAP